MKGFIKFWRTKTSVYHFIKRKIQDLKIEIIIAQGGSSSSKTVSILQVLGDLLIMNPGHVATVVGQDFPNLRRGALRDFQRILNENPAFSIMLKNPESDHGPYKFKNGSTLEFVTYGNDFQNAKNGKRQYLFINEANGVNYEVFNELESRTTILTFVDYNPNAKFWVHSELFPLARAYAFVSTFMDNEYCPDKIKAQIKGYFLKWKQTGQAYWKNKWLVYGLGQTGIVDGVVFPDWKIIESFPAKDQLSNFGYAVDFGFANDPLAIAKCGNLKGSGTFVGQELLYETGINAYSLDEIFPTLGITKNDPIVADSANLDAIDWLQKKGWNIIPADKPPGSIKQGIELSNQLGIQIVQGSTYWIIEMGNYIYKQKAGIFDHNTPIDKDNHLQDCMRMWNRYAVLNKGVNPKKMPRTKRQFGWVKIYN